MTRSSSIVQDDSIISNHNEMNKKHRRRRLQLSQSYKSHSCSRLDSTFCKSSTLSLLQDYEIDQSEIRKVLVRSLPPLASNHFMEHSFHSNPSKNGRILIPLIYSVLQKQGITTIEEFGQRKEYYHAGQEIPQVLIEFIHGLKWQGCHLRNTVRNVEAGPFQFEKLSILDDISEYLETLQCIDMKRHIFISVTGRDIIGVDPDLNPTLRYLYFERSRYNPNQCCCQN
ncbi:hypothetical protein C9374_007653 [Naegleria lovaniensis]|uniref:Uncharacterized protein n=1 Tax=Naegleria lovaniensis TaxID=51637 RepID=A0AA88KGY5_NAELO|nr:uncharacterized protein C9374_007653 [Naegleria lovaniensis]KAG2379015.1 hypothetical protein C9374_007653 [Naegleria lovaniensis]